MVFMVPASRFRINPKWLLGLKLPLSLRETKIKQDDSLCFIALLLVLKTVLCTNFNLLGVFMDYMENTEKHMKIS